MPSVNSLMVVLDTDLEISPHLGTQLLCLLALVLAITKSPGPERSYTFVA